MRFIKAERRPPFEDTSRKRAALARKQRIEREKFPLISSLVAEAQKDADTVMLQRAVQWMDWQQRYRDDRAKLWRKARSKLFAYGDNVRPTLFRLWNSSPYPKTAVYLLDMMHSYDVGRLDLENPPWIYKGSGLKAFDMAPILARAKARQEAKRCKFRTEPDQTPFTLT